MRIVTFFLCGLIILYGQSIGSRTVISYLTQESIITSNFLFKMQLLTIFTVLIALYFSSTNRIQKIASFNSSTTSIIISLLVAAIIVTSAMTGTVAVILTIMFGVFSGFAYEILMFIIFTNALGAFALSREQR